MLHLCSHSTFDPTGSIQQTADWSLVMTLSILIIQARTATLAEATEVAACSFPPESLFSAPACQRFQERTHDFTYGCKHAQLRSHTQPTDRRISHNRDYRSCFAEGQRQRTQPRNRAQGTAARCPSRMCTFTGGK